MLIDERALLIRFLATRLRNIIEPAACTYVMRQRLHAESFARQNCSHLVNMNVVFVISYSNV